MKLLLTIIPRQTFCFFKHMILVVMFLCLSGCVETVNPSLPKAVSLQSGEKKLIIVSPMGFCVDQRLASKGKGSTTLFVIDCVEVNTSNGVVTRRRPLSAVLTATVIDFQSPNVKSIDSLVSLLTIKPGINFLSRGNTNALLKVHEIESKKDLLFFLIEQRGSDIDVKQSDFFWRVFFFVDGRIISMTASNFSHGTKSQKKLKKLIGEFASNTMVANRNNR